MSGARRRREPASPVRTGIIGTVALILALAAGFLYRDLSETLSGRQYTAEFAESGGLKAGDAVLASGLRVGSVRSVVLEPGRVKVTFLITNDAVTLGQQTGASIVSQTVLGRRALNVEPAGEGTLDGAIPLARTVSPYDVTQALSDVTRTVEEIDTQTLADAARASARALEAAAPEVRPALRGMRDLARMIDARDDELAEMLRAANGVSTLLAQRRGQVQTLIGDGATLLGALNARSADLQRLLVDVVAMADQIEALIEENDAELGPALREIRGVLAIARQHKKDIDHALKSASPLMRELGEVVAAFPGFNVYIPNIPPTGLVPTLPQILMGDQP